MIPRKFSREWLRAVGAWIGKGLGALVLVAATFAGYVAWDGVPVYTVHPPEVHVEVTPDRVARGQKLAALLCTDCHADTQTGKLTGRHLTDLPAAFGDVWSKNITQDAAAGVGSWTDGELAYLLRTGVRKDGRYVPLWMIKLPHASDEDIASLIAFLRSSDPRVAASSTTPGGTSTPSFLTKALTHTVMRPLPYPDRAIVQPRASDRVAYGRYLTFTLDCFSCHSKDFMKVDILAPEHSAGYMGGGNTVMGVGGADIATANLTPDDETGIGRWSEADFVRALRKGFRPDGRALRYPMLPKTELTDDEAGAIYSYLRTIPKLHNEVPRRFPEAIASDVPGKDLYVRYGCAGCHGDTGVGMGGLADLRHANEHYATDDALRAWIEDAPSKKQDTKMPAWRGIIKDDDYAPLMQYVRSLSVPTGKQAMNDLP